LEKQAVCLLFLAENGKDLRIARTARDRLVKMPERLRNLNMDIFHVRKEARGFQALALYRI
jgi:hypothetical protein